MKKSIYIFLFVVLGVLAQQLVHTLIEIWYIKLLIKDFDKFGLGLSWDTWFIIHHIASATLLVFGISFGYLQGKYWWDSASLN